MQVLTLILNLIKIKMDCFWIKEINRELSAQLHMLGFNIELLQIFQQLFCAWLFWNHQWQNKHSGSQTISYFRLQIVLMIKGIDPSGVVGYHSSESYNEGGKIGFAPSVFKCCTFQYKRTAKNCWNSSECSSFKSARIFVCCLNSKH